MTIAAERLGFILVEDELNRDDFLLGVETCLYVEQERFPELLIVA